MIDQIRRTIEEYDLIQRGDGIVAGVSGGPDSICLLHVLAGLRDELGIRLYAVHVNHMFRGEAADEDQRFVEEFCRELGISCRSFRYDVPAIAAQKGLTSEEAGREVRYEAFYKVLNENGAQKIAVAQNLNDQAETVLMRIIRGTGTDGLAGIRHIRDGVIIRPLLDIGREEIEAYCREWNLSPRTDHTNLEPIYHRNRIRLELLPLLRGKYNSGIVPGLGRLARIAAEDSDFLNGVSMDIIRKHAVLDISGNRCSIPCAEIARQHPAIGKRIIANLLFELGLIQDITATHLDSALKLISANQTSKSLDFPAGYRVMISYGNAEFVKGNKKDESAVGLKPIKKGTLKSVIVSAGEACLNQNTELIKCFDYDRILAKKAELTIRTRREGDRFAPLGMAGSKKLKEYFIDEKIPAGERDNVPLVCVGTDIIWVVGFRMSEKYKVGPETKRVLILEYQQPL